MKSFFLKILLLILFIAGVDILVGTTLSFLIHNQDNGRYYKINYVLNHSIDEVLILGSSRAETNYHANIIGKKLGKNCWNAGRGGQGLLYINAVHEEVLRRYKPELIILNIDHDFLAGEINYDAAGILRPFARKNKAVFNTLQQKDFFEKYKLLSNIYAYNSSLFYLARPYFFKGVDGKNTDKGWKPRIGKISGITIKDGYQNLKLIKSGNYEEIPINKDKTALLTGIIQRAKKSGSKLILVVSPDFIPLGNTTTSLDIVKKIAEENEIEVIDFYNDPVFVKKPELYYDLYHMNEQGACLFSSHLADILGRE